MTTQQEQNVCTVGKRAPAASRILDPQPHDHLEMLVRQVRDVGLQKGSRRRRAEADIAGRLLGMIELTAGRVRDP